MTQLERSEANTDPTSETRVRQGVVSFRIISVLVVSTCLALAVVAGVWFGFAPHDHHGVGRANPVPARASN